MRLLLVLVLAACTEPTADMQSGSRLRLIRYELADGSQDIDRHVFHDAERGEDCSVQLFSSGVRHCMPTSAGGSTVFTEDSCTVVLGATRSAEPPVYFIRSFSLGATRLPSRLYRAGAPTDAPPLVWEQRDGYCLGPFLPEPLLTFYTVGDQIGADELVEIRSRESRSDGRLTLAIDESADGWRMPGALTDSLAGACELQPAANKDVARCIPATRANLFAGAGCTQPLALGEITASHDVDSGCWSLLVPGEPFTGTPYERIGESCIGVSANDPLYVTAAIHDPAELPRRRASSERRIASIELGTLMRDRFLYDSALAADCAIELHGEGYVCAPYSELDVRTFFSDPLCTTTLDVAFVPNGACDTPTYFAGRRPLGADFTGTLYELTTGDRCAAYVPPARFSVVLVEPELADAALVSARRVVD